MSKCTQIPYFDNLSYDISILVLVFGKDLMAFLGWARVLSRNSVHRRIESPVGTWVSGLQFWFLALQEMRPIWRYSLMQG